MERNEDKFEFIIWFYSGKYFWFVGFPHDFCYFKGGLSRLPVQTHQCLMERASAGRGGENGVLGFGGVLVWVMHAIWYGFDGEMKSCTNQIEFYLVLFGKIKMFVPLKTENSNMRTIKAELPQPDGTGRRCCCSAGQTDTFFLLSDFCRSE